MSRSSQVSVDHRVGVIDTLEVIAADEILDALLDHGDVRSKAASKHGNDLGDEQVVGKFLAGPDDNC